MGAPIFWQNKPGFHTPMKSSQKHSELRKVEVRNMEDLFLFLLKRSRPLVFDAKRLCVT
jgi:hypothetical protein